MSRRNIQKALQEISPKATLLDVGCMDGEYTEGWTQAVKAKHVMGIEVVPELVKSAKRRGIEVLRHDLNKDIWKIKDKSVDCVLSNLVIEHLSNVDLFIGESYRVLKKGGYTIVSTNNLSSWHNILSLVLGWTPFDLVNSSNRAWGIGNPYTLHYQEQLIYESSFTHKSVYTIRWLKEWYELYGFKLVSVKGAGYYPLPAFFGNIDKIHCAFMTLTFQK